MKRSLLLILSATGMMLFAASVLAADPIVGTWKLNVEKSKFSAGREWAAGTRVYTEGKGLYTLDEKLTGADGKVTAVKAHYRDGKEVKQPAGGPLDATVAKMIDANTWDFDLKKDGKTVGHVHRVVSADGKTLTVHNTGSGALPGGTPETDETLVFDKKSSTK